MNLTWGEILANCSLLYCFNCARVFEHELSVQGVWFSSLTRPLQTLLLSHSEAEFLDRSGSLSYVTHMSLSIMNWWADILLQLIHGSLNDSKWSRKEEQSSPRQCFMCFCGILCQLNDRIGTQVLQLCSTFDSSVHRILSQKPWG